MAYLVLARKFRPSVFDEIIGQEHVTRALRNAIRLDRVAHAFLFTGARGVGKTTAARVLAKALQCATGPTETPCGVCSACTEIATSSNIDVFEIDGASNRGINEIRELRDGVAYAPNRDRFKIYIIDEVHMLTTEAFNALLKTLEEPPRHVKFIFATTEPQKIPVTILSRCQRYDFKRVPLAQVKRHLDALLEKEGVTIAEEGVRMIARESEGSMRDALSLMDRVISFAGKEADAEAVGTCLGVADRKWIIDLVRAVLSGDSAGALGVVADVNQYGLDMRAFAEDVLETLRDLVVVKIAGTGARAVDLSDAEARALEALGAPHDVVALQRIFQVFLKAADEMAESRHPKLVLEMALVRATAALDLQSASELVARLESLEAVLAGVAPSRAAAPAPTRAAPVSQARPAQPSYTPQAPAPPVARPPAPRPAVTSQPPPRAPVPVPDGGGTSGTLDPSQWPSFVASVRQTDGLLATVLESARVLESQPGHLRLGVSKAFFISQLTAGPSHEKLLGHLRSRLGGDVRLSVEVASAEGTMASERKDRIEAVTATKRERVESHPMTRAAIDATGGRLVDVRVSEEDPDGG